MPSAVLGGKSGDGSATWFRQPGTVQTLPMRRRTRVLLLLLVAGVAGAFVIGRVVGGPQIKTGSYLLLNVRGQYVEAPPQDAIGRLTGGGRPLLDLLRMINAAKSDERIAGLIVRVGSLGIGWAKAQDIRDAFADFRKSNKPLLALLEQEASGSNVEYYVASAAERVYLSPAVTAPLNGLASNFVFLGGLWEKLDIELTVEKIREYKTMGDMLGNKRMTEAHREMANSLLDSINDQFVTGLAEGRQLELAAVHRLIDECPVSPAGYEAAGLSDGSKYLEAIHESLGGDQVPLVEQEDYELQLDGNRLAGNPQIAIVYAAGTIINGESTTGLQGEMAGADTLREALEEARVDENIKAVILRVDSPGGSALASDLIWRATQKVRATKPVIVSMSDVAGSGGYYISTGANRIVAQPGTFTGSIGVVFARPNVRGLLRNLGIHTETITRGRYAYLDDLTSPLDAGARTKLIDELDHIYAQFVDRVASGRGLSTEAVNDIGRGRVWTGAQAAEIGLVDDLGGFHTAIDIAKEQAGIDPAADADLVFLPKEKPLLARLAAIFAGRGGVRLPQHLEQVLRLAAHPFEEGTMLTLMPESIDIR
jgi:protease-4